MELHTCVNRLLDRDEAHRESILYIDQLHVHKNVAQVALQVNKDKQVGGSTSMETPTV